MDIKYYMDVWHLVNYMQLAFSGGFCF